MNRRFVLKAIIPLIGWRSTFSFAQQKIPVVAVPLIFADRGDVIMQSLEKGLRDRGWIDGKNIRIEHRYGQGKVELLPQLIRELAALKPDIYVAAAVPIVREVKKIAGSAPIIIVAYDYDPVAMGFVESMAHPGGNITGVYAQSIEITGKLLELLKDMTPKLKQVGVLYDELGARQLEPFKAAAKVLNLGLLPMEIRPPFDYDGLFKAAKGEGVQALALTFSPRFYGHRAQIAQTALANRLPTITGSGGGAPAGMLMSYGPKDDAMFGRTAYFIDRILRGSKVSELPVEQPNSYELVINLSSAKALGITPPEAIMVRADRLLK